MRDSTHASASSVTISSFPFLYDVAAEGRLDRLTVVDRGVAAGLLHLDQVRLVASQVRFDRGQMVSHHRVRLTSVRRATITVVARLSGLEASLAQVADLQVRAAASDRIVLSVAGHPVATVDLTRIPLVPRCPLQVSRADQTLTFSCTVSPVPAPVLAALSDYRAA